MYVANLPWECMAPDIQQPHQHQKKYNHNAARWIESSVPTIDGLPFAVER